MRLSLDFSTAKVDVKSKWRKSNKKSKRKKEWPGILYFLKVMFSLRQYFDTLDISFLGMLFPWDFLMILIRKELQLDKLWKMNIKSTADEHWLFN